MADKDPNRKRKPSRVLLAFAAATALAVGSATVGLDHVGEQRLREIAAHPATPDIACIAELDEAFAQRAFASAGDGHDVIVIPGFTTNDGFMQTLRDALEARGYDPHGWGAGFNFGADADKAAIVEDRLLRLYEENGGAKISLLGYSLGGIYARALAQKHPDKIRNVVTLGTPYKLSDDTGAPDERLSAIHELYTDGDAAPLVTAPLDVPSTAFLSSHDLLVDWKDAFNAAVERSETAVLHTLHTTMPFKPSTANAVAERLAQEPESWKSQQSLYCGGKPAP